MQQSLYSLPEADWTDIWKSIPRERQVTGMKSLDVSRYKS